MLTQLARIEAIINVSIAYLPYAIRTLSREVFTRDPALINDEPYKGRSHYASKKAKRLPRN